MVNKTTRFIEVVYDTLPKEIWTAVSKEAERSNLYGFRTGAVIFSNNYDIIGKGCSHIHLRNDKPSIHAEEAAIFNCDKPHNELDNYSILVLSIGKANYPAYCSKPCFSCLSRIVKTNIRYVFWPERDNAGNWSVCCEEPEVMYDNAILNGTRVHDFARNMRL